MTTLAEVRAVLAETLSQQLAVQVYPYPTINPQLPAVIVEQPERVDYRDTFTKSTKTVTLPLRLLVAWTDEPSCHDLLDDLVEQVVEVLRSDPDLDDTVDSVDVVEVRDFGSFTLDGSAGTDTNACTVALELLL